MTNPLTAPIPNVVPLVPEKPTATESRCVTALRVDVVAFVPARYLETTMQNVVEPFNLRQDKITTTMTPPVSDEALAS